MAEISVADAHDIMLGDVTSLPAESIPLAQAWGRTLAAPVRARRDQPPFAASAMDGYALRRADADAEPARLRVVGESAAGRAYVRLLASGEAVRIFTGAPVPQGADLVLVQEDARREGDDLLTPALTGRSDNIRRAAIDFARGDTLLSAGDRLDGIALALVAGAGEAHVDVVRKPRVALLSTGTEIVPPGTDAGPDQIFESVSYGLAGLIEAWGGIPIRLAAQADELAAIAEASRRALAEADLLVTIGGASVGDYDLVKPALATLGVEQKVQKIAIRPGKPTWFGADGAGGLVLGLPGNPASALVCAHLFLRPLIERMLGRSGELLQAQAILSAPLGKNGPRAHYIRAFLGAEGAQRTVTPFEMQDSSLLSVVASADALIKRAPNAAAGNVGEVVDCVPLGRF